MKITNSLRAVRVVSLANILVAVACTGDPPPSSPVEDEAGVDPGGDAYDDGGGEGASDAASDVVADQSADQDAGSEPDLAVPSTFFGMHINQAETPWPSVSLGSIRAWDSYRTAWALMNTAPNTFSFTNLDQLLRDAKTNGVDDVLYNLGRTPTWASQHPEDKDCDYATNATNGGQCWPMTDLNPDGTGTNRIWKDWITAVATHARGLDATHARIKYWEIWNEFHRGSLDPNPTAGGSWQGSYEQMVRLAEDARCIITGKGHITATGAACTATAIDPNAVILSANTGSQTPAARTVLKRYLYCASGACTTGSAGSAAADVISIHDYAADGLAPEGIRDQIKAVKDLLSAADLAKPLWATEGSWGPPGNLTDLDRQAAFVARYVLTQRSLGVARLYWYIWDGGWGRLWSANDGDGCTVPDAKGGYLCPSGVAYREVRGWLVGATLDSACSVNGTTWTCDLSRPNGYVARAVWDTSCANNTTACSTVAYPVDPKFVRYRDLAGKVTAVTSTTVPIGYKPILLENQ